MEELTSERYKEFKANDCVKTEPDIKEHQGGDERGSSRTAVTAKQPSSRAISGGAIVSIESAANFRLSSPPWFSETSTTPLAHCTSMVRMPTPLLGLGSQSGDAVN